MFRISLDRVFLLAILAMLPVCVSARGLGSGPGKGVVHQKIQSNSFRAMHTIRAANLLDTVPVARPDAKENQPAAVTGKTDIKEITDLKKDPVALEPTVKEVATIKKVPKSRRQVRPGVIKAGAVKPKIPAAPVKIIKPRIIKSLSLPR